MNPLLIESTIRTALSASAFPDTPIQLGSDYQELTPESQNLIVSCGDVEHTAGGLYKAAVAVRVVSPALLGADSLSEMSGTISALRSGIESIGEDWPNASGTPGYGGVWIRSVKTSHEEHTWVAEIEATIGISI